MATDARPVSARPAGEAAPRLGDPTLRPAAAIAAALRVDPEQGLSDAEAADRLATYGPNELRSTPPEPGWHRLLRQFQDPLVYLLLVAVAISVLAWLVEGATGVPVDALVIVTILLVNAVIGFVQERRAVDAVAALRTMTAARSEVLRDGRRQTVPSADLVPGDVLLLSEGDTVGADARLLTGAALRIQESSLTGESQAVEKHPAVLTAPVPLGDRLNMAYKGTAVARGVGRAVVTATGMDTEMGAIAGLLDRTEDAETPLDREIAHVSRALGRIVIGIAVVVMVTIVLVNDVRTPAALVDVLLLGVSLAVAAVPEGLPAILSVVLAIGVQQLARHRAVVKQLSSVETLGSASVICSDKTGTLTRNEMTIQRLVTASGTVELSGIGYRPEGEASHEGRPLGTPAADGPLLTEARTLLRQGSLANDAQLTEQDGAWSIQGDPTEAAFLVAARKLEGPEHDLSEYERLAEVPFTSERKMMSTLHSHRGQTRLLSKGAPDVLLDRCDSHLIGDRVRPLDEATRRDILDQVEELSSQAYRTLGVAYREAPAASAPTPEETAPEEAAAAGPIPDGATGWADAESLDESAEEHLTYVGMVAIIDPPRPEAEAAIRQAHRAGIRTIMITGDHPSTAARIGADLGIISPDGRALSGGQLDELTDEEFRAATREVSVYARVAPEHKLRIVDALQDDGRIVAMTGDGVNDAPALKAADIGIAMGRAGTEVTKEAARMILADDNFATIVEAVEQGRVIFANIKKFLRYLLSSNMGEVCTIFLGVLLAAPLGLVHEVPGGLALPLLATQILWINLVTDSAPALAMGVDPQIDDVMADPPRDPRERVIDRRMWLGIGLVGAVMGLVTLLTIDLWLPGGLVPGSHTYVEAQTAAFTTLVFAQLFNALSSRSETVSAFHRLFANRWLWASIGAVAVLQVLVVEVPFLQAAFSTAPLTLQQWLVCAAMASVVLWANEIRKAILRAADRRR
ncbi:cation-translocating P-type ATPase [Raineyella sp. W15-4]|uniref:cation-translocating P-type ATPase n=1 Tax=Raineyella sp. W15-4 TaxID=3081651 RepID=UPI002953A96E|nr:cation-translocating P-type ATPase [Raineyella sp. W15-4]WOQ17798.1 cation-translocating P-type ATPase [Raineyella sp. W15-4]